MEINENYYLGFDFSTQSLKAIISQNTKIISTFVVNFEKDLPSYGTKSGFLTNSNNEYYSNVLMFLEALDLILTQIKTSGFDFKKIKATSGSGQQHGSVYWKKSARERLQKVSYSKPLKENFVELDLLASELCPIWMDNSTSKYVNEMESKFTARELFNLSGSKGHERFTGQQIHKIARKKKELYSNCDHISLISSFFGEVFIGDYSCTDYSDGSGMNLININTLK